LEEVTKWDEKISEIGGREEYQRASQMNTSLFSTSRWVLGVLGRWGWLDGLPVPDAPISQGDKGNHESKRRKNAPRRDLRVLEIGAINTQLLDAAARTKCQPAEQRRNDINQQSGHSQNALSEKMERVHRLEVHAIDIRSTNDRIQQIDFFNYPLPNNDLTSRETNSTTPSQTQRLPYDVLVNSMVINCVTTPEQRGHMLDLCYQQLRPGGVLFLTLPKLCLKQSKFMTSKYFEEILTDGLGFDILDEVAKDSPKLVFYVLRRPEIEKKTRRDDFGCIKILNTGKKYRNQFSIQLLKRL
jgi:25S rRNA (adenine2142-N1)-methyltransferase